MPSSSSKTESQVRYSEAIGVVLLLLALQVPEGPSMTNVPAGQAYCAQDSGKPSFLQYAATLLQQKPECGPTSSLLLHDDEEEETVTEENSIGSSSTRSRSPRRRRVVARLTIEQFLALKSDKSGLLEQLNMDSNKVDEDAGLFGTMARGFAYFMEIPKVVSSPTEDPAADYDLRSLPTADLSEAEIKALTQWQCSSCQFSNPQGQMVCASAGCQKPNEQPQRAWRAFLGQLRKERTIETVQWLLAVTNPTIMPLHVESHTNVKTGRGKGCSWVYLRSEQDMSALLGLHKRVFLDVVDGVEGAWLVHGDDAAALDEYSAAQSRTVEEAVYLPRQPLVVEKPADRVAAVAKKKKQPRVSVDQATSHSAATPVTEAMPTPPRSGAGTPQPERFTHSPSSRSENSARMSSEDTSNSGSSSPTPSVTPAPSYYSYSPSARTPPAYYDAYYQTGCTCPTCSPPPPSYNYGSCSCCVTPPPSYNYAADGSYSHNPYATSYAGWYQCSCAECTSQGSSNHAVESA